MRFLVFLALLVLLAQAAPLAPVPSLGVTGEQPASIHLKFLPTPTETAKPTSTGTGTADSSDSTDSDATGTSTTHKSVASEVCGSKANCVVGGAAMAYGLGPLSPPGKKLTENIKNSNVATSFRDNIVGPAAEKTSMKFLLKKFAGIDIEASSLDLAA